MKTESFKCEVDGKEVEVIVRSPNENDRREAAKVYNQTFSDAIKAHAIVRLKIDDVLKEQGLWDDTKQQRLEELQRKIQENERKLVTGGIKVSEGKNIAFEMQDLRDELVELLSVRSSLDVNTAEGQADNARFNYLVSACTVYKDSNKPCFSSLDDYLSKSFTELAVKAAQNFGNLYHGLDSNYKSNLPEFKFLKKFKFVDDKLRLVNKDGHLVDREGRLIDEHGRYVNEKGEFVDRYGYRIDEAGEYVVDNQPFLDDEGNPIVEETTNEVSTTKELQPQS